MIKIITVEKFVAVFAVIISSIAAYVSLNSGYILAYNDATAHLNTARRVIDSLTPGIVQLGSVWLPLLHILQIPFVANYYLWQSGLAGWAVSGISFVLTSLFLYKLTFYFTKNRLASFFSVLVLSLNANLLYLQTTAMFEPLLMFTATASIYYLAKWAKENVVNYLIYAAFFTMLATLTRYDGWALFIANSIYVIILSFVKGIKHKEGILFFFLFLAGFGIFLWFMYNWVIFSDPLYFQSGEFSAAAQQKVLDSRGLLPTKDNFNLSFKTYSMAVILNIGLLPLILGIIGLVWYLIKNILKPSEYAPFLLVVPYPFNILSLILGQSVIWIPFVEPYFDTYFNIRYGLLVIPAIAFFIAYLASKHLSILLVSFILLLLQFYLFLKPDISYPLLGRQVGMVTLLDTVSSVNEQTRNASDFIKENYDGGLILASSASIDAFIFRSGLPLKYFITEGTGDFWKESLENPRKHAKWIVYFQDTTDRVGKFIIQIPKLENYYERVYEDQTYIILKRKE